MIDPIQGVARIQANFSRANEIRLYLS